MTSRMKIFTHKGKTFSLFGLPVHTESFQFNDLTAHRRWPGNCNRKTGDDRSGATIFPLTAMFTPIGPGWADTGVLYDLHQPLIFYQVDSSPKPLKVTKSGPDVRLDW